MQHEIAIVGFGNQGQPWAMNLRDRGWKVHLLLRSQGASSKRAKKKGFHPESISHLGKFPIVTMLIPDDCMPEFFSTHGHRFRHCQHIVFAHGFSLHFHTAPWPKTTDWILVAPQAIGPQVRRRMTDKSDIPVILGVENNHTGKAWQVAKMVAQGIGSHPNLFFKTSVQEEVEANLFCEQAIFYGGLVPLIAQVFHILTTHGVDPRVAYLECMAPLPFIMRLFDEKGICETLQRASPTARFGGFQASKKLCSPAMHKRLESLFHEIQKGSFSRKLSHEARGNYRFSHKALVGLQKSLLEKTGRKIRQKRGFLP